MLSIPLVYAKEAFFFLPLSSPSIILALLSPAPSLSYLRSGVTCHSRHSSPTPDYCACLRRHCEQNLAFSSLADSRRIVQAHTIGKQCLHCSLLIAHCSLLIVDLTTLLLLSHKYRRDNVPPPCCHALQRVPRSAKHTAVPVLCKEYREARSIPRYRYIVPRYRGLESGADRCCWHDILFV